jgi:hypothetical protein
MVGQKTCPVPAKAFQEPSHVVGRVAHRSVCVKVQLVVAEEVVRGREKERLGVVMVVVVGP